METLDGLILLRGCAMKKKVAVFTGGWSDEYLQEVIHGMETVAKQEAVDLFVFTNFTSSLVTGGSNDSEFNILKLPEFEDFDGVVMLGNSFNIPCEISYFKEKLMSSRVPAVSIEYKFDGVVSVFTNNYAGMHDLATHMIGEHGARNILFIGGPKEHMESAERLKALLDAANESGFELPDGNIKYGDWSKASAIACLQEWMQENEGLPDAVVCANDVMAMGVCDFLWENEYRVPEDVLVTGYDCLRSAQEYLPAIASVNHEWGPMGEAALQLLLKGIRGEEMEDIVLGTRFVAGGSCGCNCGSDKEILAKRKKQKSPIDSLTADMHFRFIYLAVRKAEEIEDLSGGLSYCFAQQHMMEGEDFMLCLDPEFFRIVEGDTNLRTEGYSEQVEVVGAIRGGQWMPHRTMDRKEAMFYFAEEKKEPGVYIFLPVYSDNKTYGFAVQTCDLRVAGENQLYIWTRHINENMEQVRRNITIAELTKKLTALSVTDALTGVYNRAGCEKIAYPMLKNWKENGGTGIVMLIDVDKMKTINDKYGHENGDLALCTVTSVLKKVLPENWIISRFGGDEFFIGGCVPGGTVDLKALRYSLEKSLEQEVKERNIKFRLTISIGCVMIRPEDEVEIEEYLQLADDDMYAVKAIHHKMQEEK